MNEIFRQEFYYLKQIFQSSRIQKFKGNNWEKAFLVLTLYLSIDIFLGIVRLRFGFLWAVLLHSSFNLIASLDLLYL